MNGSLRRHLLFFGFMLILVASLALVLQDFSRQVIIARFARAIWVGHLLFQSIPRWVLWISFLTLALFVAVRSLRKDSKPFWKATDEERSSSGPVEAEMRWIRLAAWGSYGQWRLAQRLAELTLEALAHRERANPARIKHLLIAGALGVPPEVLSYLRAGLGSVMPKGGGFMERLRHLWRPFTYIASPESDAERVVRFLEDQTGVQRGR